MSEREQAKQIIDQLPDYKIGKVLLFLKGVQFSGDIEVAMFDNLLKRLDQLERRIEELEKRTA